MGNFDREMGFSTEIIARSGRLGYFWALKITPRRLLLTKN
jgi:hypothetical protein